MIIGTTFFGNKVYQEIDELTNKVRMLVQDGYVAKDTQDALFLLGDFGIPKELIKGYNIDLNDKQEIVVEVV